MICTVSTVLDSPANLQRFVESNLAMGVDHLFLVIDLPDRADQAEAFTLFAEHPHVTLIAGDATWWARRPSQLNRRQVINANRVLWALLPTSPRHWLFHIDADEVLALGPHRMDRVPADVHEVRVPPAESVAVWTSPEYETRFKPCPTREQVEQYAAWGIIDEPNAQLWLHGYFVGKSGVRVNSGARLGLHTTMSPDATKHFSDHLPDSWVLHHHVRSGADAIAKAAAFGLNSFVGLSDHKRVWVEELQLLATQPDGATRRARERQIFEEHLADRVDLMEARGVLMHVDPREHQHTPATFSLEEQQLIRDRLAQVSGLRNGLFRLALPEEHLDMFGRY